MSATKFIEKTGKVKGKRQFKRFFLLSLIVSLLGMQCAFGNDHQPRFSTAGFYQVEGTGREVFSLNVAWRFHKGPKEHGESVDLDDSEWQVVSVPHGIEVLPVQASGGINYQGEVWYRKFFDLPEGIRGKKLFVHFEAIMGKSRIYLNGHLLKENFGGYLPAIVDITDHINPSGVNVLAVWADNSDDPNYPPGKSQDLLDFAYFGGIYRDCWLIAHQKVYITDPNDVDIKAGGGLFVAFEEVTEQQANILLQLHIKNEDQQNFSGLVEYELKTIDGRRVSAAIQNLRVNKGESRHFSRKLFIGNPELWTPESPNLYHLFVTLKDRQGNIVDGYMRRLGIRSIEFKGKDGLWLNGKPYGKPLIGANRHQDFALVGNAVPNATHWRDAKKLRDAGLKIIRNAHYPQDPAFMDACDELGLFVIVNTPGWQFWSEEPVFEQRIYQDIRNMVRRDRNHPSVILWEPVLNETWYPEHFAKNTQDIVLAEYPFPYCYTVCDAEARGNEYFPVLYGHPAGGDASWAISHIDENKNYFTREWGDNVDDWNSHNSPSRVKREWGEDPMLIQARHYANPPYKYTSLELLHKTPPQHIGGCLWHPFDHNRGYHPDPFYGGILDGFRQPKYSYYLFMSQRDPRETHPISESGPMVYIAHEMSPFSSPDVTVFSNCDEVRLKVFENGQTHTYLKDKSRQGMPSPVIVFEDAWDFMQEKALAMNDRHEESFMLAEGLIDGQVVATHRIKPARRPSRLLLWFDDENVNLRADGSDYLAIVAAVADADGQIRARNNYRVYFEVEGEGRMIGGNHPLINPVPVEWGTATALIQSTAAAGTIKVRARVIPEGTHMPLSAEIEFLSVSPNLPLVFWEEDAERLDDTGVSPEEIFQRGDEDLLREIETLKQELNKLRLKEVEEQQRDFGERQRR
jgi:beta-galactosidase